MNYVERMEAALSNDLNTPLAITIMDECTDKIHEAVRDGKWDQVKALQDQLRTCGNMIGVLLMSPEEWFAWRPEGALPDDVIKAEIQKRAEAKKAGDYKLADRIRDELKGKGITLNDAKDGTTTFSFR